MRKMTDAMHAARGDLLNLLADYIRAALTGDVAARNKYQAALAERGISITITDKFADPVNSKAAVKNSVELSGEQISELADSIVAKLNETKITAVNEMKNTASEIR